MRLTSLLISLLSTCLAATTTITGTVSDATNLHPSSRATLRDIDNQYSSYISSLTGSFQFFNVEGNKSYILSLSSLTHSFPTFRIDVSTDLEVVALKTTRGQKWSHAGPRVSYPVTIHPISVKDYYVPRPSINILGLLKNPILWLGLVMVFTIFVLPKVTELVDPEGVKEMHEIRARKAEEAKNAPAVANPVEQLQNFDVSGWLAGKK